MLAIACAVAIAAAPSAWAGGAGATIELAVGMAKSDSDVPMGPRDDASHSLGTQFAIRGGVLFGRLGWRLAVARRVDETKVVTEDTGAPVTFIHRSETRALDASVEVRLRAARRVRAVLFGGPGVVALRATNAEEFERAVSVHAGAGAEIDLGKRFMLRTDARWRASDDGNRDLEVTLGFGIRIGAP